MSNNNSNNNNTPKPKSTIDFSYPIDEDEEAIKITNNNDDDDDTATTTNNNPQPKSEWDKYLDSLDQARLKKTIELAKQSKYVINGKPYDRKKIKVKNFNTLERMRAAFAYEKNPRKSTEILIQVYEKCALFYLDMQKEEYEDLDDWEEIKLILDACAYRSIRSLPN